MHALSTLLGAGLLIGILGTSPAFADSSPPPTRVGRLSLADGSVGYRPAGGNWSEASVNLPVATGTALRTDSQSRAEFSLGDRRIALAPDTELDLAIIDDQTTELTVKHGRIGVELRRVAADETIQIDIPSGGVWLTKPGHYDIAAATASSPTRVEAFDGSARFVGGGADTTVGSDSAAVLQGTPLAATTEPVVADSFTGSWRAKDSSDHVLPATLHLSPEIGGIGALDADGHWEAISGYGPVWFANATAPDWTPFRDGKWRWIAPWGWTWVDDAPWGFATSHYGRWARIGEPGGDAERWGWVPGTPLDHPAYAPATVGFIGTAGVGLSYPDAGGPAIAWYPLVPDEVYWPGFTHKLEAIRRLNAGAVADPEKIGAAADGTIPAEIIGGHDVNRRFASAIPHAAFTAGKPVRPALIDIPRRRLEEAPEIVASLQFPPPPPPPQMVAKAVPSGPVKALTVVMARLAIPSTPPLKPPPLKPAVTTRNLQVLAGALVVHPVKVARFQAVLRVVRAPTRSTPASAASHSAPRRQHLAAARSPGR